MIGPAGPFHTNSTDSKADELGAEFWISILLKTFIKERGTNIL